MPDATSDLARIRLLAQVVTIAAAALYSVLWAVTVLGGVGMGLLYAFDRWRAWSTQKSG